MLPTINISPKVRFILYLIGVVGAVLVQYAIDKSWFGDSEMRLWSGISAVLLALAAAKTNLSDTGTTVVQGRVVSETGETGTLNATMTAINADEGTDADTDDGLTYTESGGQPYPSTVEDGSPDRY